MADNNSYVIQIENSTNNNEDQITTSNADDSKINFEPVQTNLSRRTSISSQHSLISQPASNLSICCYSPVNYDSGNYSISDINTNRRPPSLSSADDEPFTSSSGHEKELREKNQFIFLAQQDVRKLRSEVDRVSKSEKWYRNELRIQKRSRLEILEKLYLNERNFFHENQKLQTECAHLYTIIRDVEKKSVQDKEHLLKQIKDEQDIKNNFTDKGTLNSRNIKFEIRKLKGTIQEHEQLIDILRRQKQSLLNDLRNLTSEKDAKIIVLEKNCATLDEENRKIIEKCKKIIVEKNELENGIKLKKLSISRMKRNSFNLAIIEGNSTFQSLENNKTCDKILNNFSSVEESQQLLTGSPKNPHQMLNIPVNIKSQQNSSKKGQNLQDNSDQLQRELEILNFKLQEKLLEIENLKSVNFQQNKTISELQLELVENKNLCGNYENSIQINKDNLKKKDLMIKELQHLVENKKEIEEENKKLLNSLNVTKEDLDNRTIDLHHSNRELLTLKNIIETQKEEISLMLREKNNFENILSKKYENIFKEKDMEIFQLNTELVNAKFENNKILSEQEKYINMPNEIKNLKIRLENENSTVQKLVISNKELEDFIKYHKLNYEKEELNKHQVYEELCSNIKTMQTELQICNLEYDKLKSEQLAKNTVFENLKLMFKQQSKLIHNFNAATLVKENHYSNENTETNVEMFKPLLKESDDELHNLLDIFNDTQQIINKTSNILNNKNSEIEILKNIILEYSETESSNKEKFELIVKNVNKLKDENDKLKSDMQSQLISFESTNNNLVKVKDNFENELLLKNDQLDENTNRILKLTEQLNAVSNNIELSKKLHQNAIKKLQNGFSKDIANNETLIQSLKANLEFKENEINNLIVEKIKFENYCGEYESKFKILEIKKLEDDMKIKSLENSCYNKVDYCVNCEKSQDDATILNGNSSGSSSINSSPSDQCIVDELKQIKVLKNVIEIEHKKKIARYEVHIRTLLSNIKSYKKNIEIVENQYGKLLKKYETLESSCKEQEKSEEKIAKNLAEIKNKYKESEKMIKVYKSELKVIQNQLENIYVYKNLNSNLKGSLTNLMDDYKSLIHQTVSLNVNKSNPCVDFSSIYDLIKKSNNFVPNLNCLSESVTELKYDIDKFQTFKMINNHNDANTASNLIWSPAMIEKRKSLMDELKEICNEDI